mgnify:CR=1 FL=1
MTDILQILSPLQLEPAYSEVRRHMQHRVLKEQLEEHGLQDVREARGRGILAVRLPEVAIVRFLFPRLSPS